MRKKKKRKWRAKKNKRRTDCGGRPRPPNGNQLMAPDEWAEPTSQTIRSGPKNKNIYLTTKNVK